MIVYFIQEIGSNKNSPGSLNVLVNYHYHGENRAIIRQLPSMVDAACGGVWFNRTLHQVNRMGVDVITPGNVFNYVSVEHAPSPVLIGSVTT